MFLCWYLVPICMLFNLPFSLTGLCTGPFECVYLLCELLHPFCEFSSCILLWFTAILHRLSDTLDYLCLVILWPLRPNLFLLFARLEHADGLFPFATNVTCMIIKELLKPRICPGHHGGSVALHTDSHSLESVVTPLVPPSPHRFCCWPVPFCFWPSQFCCRWVDVAVFRSSIARFGRGCSPRSIWGGAEQFGKVGG